MAPPPTDFTVEILRVPPGTTLGPSDLVTVTDRTSIEDIGSINRAVDRDLLNFKTGDVTLGFWDADGFMADLFALFGVTDRWQLRIFRRGAIQFWGVLIGQGSIHFDKKEKTCELTAYGLTRMLNDRSAEGAQRYTETTLTDTVAINQTVIRVKSSGGFGVGEATYLYDGVNVHSTSVASIPDQFHLVLNSGPSRVYNIGATVIKTHYTLTLTGAHVAGATVINCNDTNGMLPKDTVHLRNAAQNLTEDVVVKYVNSATQFTVAAAIVNTYANGDLAAVTTPFYRYKTIRFLVEELCNAAGFLLADYRMSRSVFNTAGPAPVSHGGLGVVRAVWSPAAERNGRAYVVVDTLGTYYQPTNSPDSDWTLEDALLRPWVDWSRYRKQTDGAPNIILRFPDNAGIYLIGGIDEWMCGFDDRDATTKYAYRARVNAGGSQLVRNSTTNGTTWTGWVDFGAASGASGGGAIDHVEFDQARGQVYVLWSGPAVLMMYDIGAAAWTTVNNAALQATGLRYIPERDYVLGSYEAVGGARTMVAYRNGARVFERVPAGMPTYVRSGTVFGFPNNPGYQYLTMGARYLDGKIYFSAAYDNAACQVSSADDFVTVTVRKYIAGTIFVGGAFGSRIADAMRWFPHSSNSVTARAYHASAAFYAGVVAYADFEGKSCAEALKDLAVLANALFWVDDDGQAHFVARDLYDPGAVLPLDDGVNRLDMDRTDDPIWEESVSYVEVAGGGFEAVSGLKAFSSSGISLDSALIPNEAFAQALADAFYDFYGRRRAFIEMNVRDPDGTIYQPLDRKTLDGIRYLVYESDHNLAEDEVSVKLLEDA